MNISTSSLINSNKLNIASQHCGNFFFIWQCLKQWLTQNPPVEGAMYTPTRDERLQLLVEITLTICILISWLIHLNHPFNNSVLTCLRMTFFFWKIVENRLWRSVFIPRLQCMNWHTPTRDKIRYYYERLNNFCQWYSSKMSLLFVSSYMTCSQMKDCWSHQ